MVNQALLDQLCERVQKTQHGFTDIRQAADEVVARLSSSECSALAHALRTAESHQARMLATFIFGHLAAHSSESLHTLRTVVSRDPDWRVQEILAQAFDMTCKMIGYEAALPMISAWLTDAEPNVRRAASEGLRLWTSRPYFKTHPEQAINLLSALRADQSEYVRISVGNALRDISRKHQELVRRELTQWDIGQKPIAQTYKLASKFIE